MDTVTAPTGCAAQVITTTATTACAVQLMKEQISHAERDGRKSTVARLNAHFVTAVITLDFPSQNRTANYVGIRPAELSYLFLYATNKVIAGCAII